MCDLCEESETGEMQSCQDCGRLICFDVQGDDDVVTRAGVSSSGDLYCSRCAAQHDREEEDADDQMEFDGDEWPDDDFLEAQTPEEGSGEQPTRGRQDDGGI